MQIQNLLLGALLSVLLAVNTTGNAAEDNVQKDKVADPAKTPKAQTKRTPATVEANPGVADHTKNADNTKVNKRDRKDSLTPMDQSNGAAQVAITANIRKALMGDKTVSFDGKNVKIITVGTKVTLRGPVKTSQERTTIEGIAKHTAGVTDVDNQLEVIN